MNLNMYLESRDLFSELSSKSPNMNIIMYYRPYLMNYLEYALSGELGDYNKMISLMLTLNPGIHNIITTEEAEALRRIALYNTSNMIDEPFMNFLSFYSRDITFVTDSDLNEIMTDLYAKNDSGLYDNDLVRFVNMLPNSIIEIISDSINLLDSSIFIEYLLSDIEYKYPDTYWIYHEMQYVLDKICTDLLTELIYSPKILKYPDEYCVYIKDALIETLSKEQNFKLLEMKLGLEMDLHLESIAKMIYDVLLESLLNLTIETLVSIITFDSRILSYITIPIYRCSIEFILHFLI